MFPKLPSGGLEGEQLVTITGQDFGVETRDVITEHVEVYFGGANNPDCNTCEQPVTQCIPEHSLSSSTILVGMKFHFLPELCDVHRLSLLLSFDNVG